MDAVSGQPRVSVVVPVYNSVDHLGECLESLVRQSIGFENVEVVAVDDGSTDGSGELLDEWARRHANIRVLHQANSGAPGGPRNRAIEAATGDFLFFADPDDHLGAEALQRLTEAADRDGSDVVLGRVEGVGRTAATAPFRTGVSVGDIWSTRSVWSLTAHKLVRRSLVDKHRLRFAEGLRLAEEQVFIVSAYFLANSISVVSDYVCYYLVRREGVGHLTLQTPEPEPFYANIRDVLDIVVAHTDPGDRRNQLLCRWVNQEVLRYFGPGFGKLTPALRQRFARSAASLLRDYVPLEVDAGLTESEQVRLRLLREGRTKDLLAYTERLRGPGAPRADPPPAWLSRSGPSRLARALRRRLRNLWRGLRA